MSSVVITLTDDEDGKVDVQIDFGDAGANDDSAAHHMAVSMLSSVTGGEVANG